MSKIEYIKVSGPISELCRYYEDCTSHGELVSLYLPDKILYVFRLQNHIVDEKISSLKNLKCKSFHMCKLTIKS